MVEGGLSELGETVVILDVGRCGSRPKWRNEAASRFLTCGSEFRVFLGAGYGFFIHLMFRADKISHKYKIYVMINCSLIY